MTTAVDSSVLLDVLGGDITFGLRSTRAMRRCAQQGRLIASDVVWAEVLGNYASASEGREALESLRVEFVPVDLVAASVAATAWHGYRSRGGPRTRVIADFLVGAHAEIHADRLLTRDRGFYRSCFSKLSVVDPSAGSG